MWSDRASPPRLVRTRTEDSTLLKSQHYKQDCLQSRDSDSANDLLNYAAGAGLCGLFFVSGRAGRLLRSWG